MDNPYSPQKINDTQPAFADELLDEYLRMPLAKLQKLADAPVKATGGKRLMKKLYAIHALARIRQGGEKHRFWSPPYGEPEWVTIPAGEFWMGSEKGLNSHEKPAHRLYLDEFQISYTPVTNSQFAIYVRETGAEPPYHWRKGTIYGDHPVVYVSWYEAVNYCKWLGEKTGKQLTLPSEAEWEKAARGDLDQREYPWGEWDDLQCNSGYLGFQKTTPVSLFLNGSSPYGLLDMCGNVDEWTRSIYGEHESIWGKRVSTYGYPYITRDRREDMSQRDRFCRVLRGGSFHTGKHQLRCSSRSYDYPFETSGATGFRVVTSMVDSD